MVVCNLVSSISIQTSQNAKKYATWLPYWTVLLRCGQCDLILSNQWLPSREWLWYAAIICNVSLSGAH